MSLNKNRKKANTPANPTFHYIKWGSQGFEPQGLVNVMKSHFEANTLKIVSI